MSAVTFRIPADVQQRQRDLCRQQHRSTSEVVRESLRRYIVAEELRHMRDKLRPFAQAKGLLTDDDVFNMVS